MRLFFAHSVSLFLFWSTINQDRAKLYAISVFYRILLKSREQGDNQMINLEFGHPKPVFTSPFDFLELLSFKVISYCQKLKFFLHIYRVLA